MESIDLYFDNAAFLGRLDSHIPLSFQADANARAYAT